MATSGNNQYFNVTIGANMDVGGVLGAVKQMQGAFNGLKLPANLTGDILKDFDKLRESLNKFKSISSKETIGKADLKALSKLQSEIDSTFSHLSNSFDELSGKTFYLDADFTAIKDARAEVENLKADLKNKLSGIKIDLNSAQGGKVSLGIEKIVNDMERGVKTSKVLSASMREVSNSIQTGNFDAAKNKLAEIENKATTLKGASAGLLETFRQWGIIDFSGTARGLVDANKHADLLHAAFQKIREGISGNDEEIKNLVNSIDTAEEKVTNLEKAGRINAAKPISEAKDVTDQLAVSAHNAAQSERELGDATARAANEVKQLQQSTQYFFSLRNMINLLKRGIDEAVQSVKELDKAMTETAVVTDYKVSDLWGMLPEYTKVANQLGATTQGAYETMTLYYQQGLEQQQAFELGAETMKMARIAGLDYAETTDMMTAALRGFNMELNETSAKRVNDVYSELAAITASDTEELGTAMQRTASIAASAGASFEGTTAFLAQAIETTREPAENIGTAMKTIVARFQEMKKNPLEISEVDGEEVDYNKIDAALKSIGVDLKDTNGQFREFDQVMLDISAKWNTLSQSQQRYIATTAAGSRQQSRFIAMVSNYDRTMQLMEAANNSAGASDEQFGKTMDSLESKLNQLHNAWQQFTMGIANNDMIKMAVDGLTGFLNITNKIIDTLSLGSGALKSFLSIFAAFTGLKMAGRGANALIGGLGGLVDPKSSVKEGLKIGLFGQGKNAAQAKAITTPIVGSLSKISGQIAAIAKRQGIKDAGQKGNAAGVKEISKEDYANTKRLFSQLSGKEGFKMGDTSKLFGNLDAKHQLSMFNNSPGTKLAMKQASLNWFNSKGLSSELTSEGKQLINSIYKGMAQGQIPVDKGIELIGRPDLWGEHFATDTAKAISKNFNLSDDDRRNVVDKTWSRLGMKLAAPETREAWLKENQDKYDKVHSQVIQDLFGHTQSQGKVSDLGRLANDIGSIGDKFTQAGYGITTFGNALSQLGGPIGAVGTGIAAFGSAISSMGMMVSGATSLITVFSEGIEIAGTSIAISGGAIAAVAAPLAAAAAAFLLVRAHLKKVKEAGEEVTNTFNETNKTAEDNIAKLKSYQSEFATLSKGVDANGNNVSLDDSQYQRYLEIVDDIAAINPDIVEGYNAQGHAIINNNKALAETLKTQQEIRDEARNTYTSEDSLQKLINARNINNDFKAINVKGESPSVYDGSGHGSEGRQKPVGLGRDVFNIVDQLRLNKDFDESSLQKYGIDSLDSLINGEEQAVKNFIKHRQQIQADLTNSGLKLNESIIKGFDKLGEDAAAFDEAIKPVYDNLLANISNSKVFESIAPEFRNALNMGLKDLASQDLDAPEMAKAANNMTMRFANLTNGSGKYKDALDIVEKAQDSFASSLDETQYYADVQPAIDDLIRLKEEALNEGSAYGDALAEYLENQIQRISNFTTEGGANLTEALNTATDEIVAAEGALDSFNEATKKDFSTAAEGMKGIFDKTTETFKDSYGTEIQKHAEGMGDATFWTGAEALLSGKEIERLTKGKDGYEAAKAVKKSIEGLEPILREGQEGFDAFTDRVLENADALDKLEGVKYDENGLLTNVPDDQWHNVAEALGISDDLLTSMLNKGRQFADISFMNVEDARKALAASDYTIQGNSSTAGNKNLYVKEDTLRMELSDAGYVRREQQNEQIEKLLAQGVKTIPASDSKELTQDKLKDMADDWGVKTLPDLIQTLNDTGDFTKDEIQDYAEKLDLIGDLDFDTVYSDLISALDNPELAKQTQELSQLSGTTAEILAHMPGSTPQDQLKEAEAFRKETFGNTGVDTAVEAFGQGKKLGKDGTLEFMTPEEFATQSKYVSDLVNNYNKAAKQAQDNADATTGATSKSYQQVADYYTKLAADTQREYERGLANYESNLQRQENAAKKTAEREESVRQAKIKKIPKNIKANEDNKTKTPGQTKTETIETTTKKTNTEKNETTKKTTIVDGKTTPGFKETEQATESLENKDGMVVNVATKAELAGANAVIKSLGGINDKEVSVITKGDTSGADTVKTAIANVTGKIVTIGTKLGSTNAIKIIDDKIAALARKGNNIKIGTTQYKGQNNHIPYQSMPSFGSAARGRGGTVGPKNKGGLTLTGEKGFEIAWLPRENRSIILGAGGPQMLNLPSDAVVYTHEQSKQILKRKGIPAGSHADENASSSSYHKKYNNSIVTTTVTIGTHEQKQKSADKSVTQAAKEITKITQKAGKVLVWWENAARRMDKAQHNADIAQKKLEALLKEFGTTGDKYREAGKKYEKYLKQQQNIANQEKARADSELKMTNKGRSEVLKQQDKSKTQKEINEQKAAKKRLDAAKEQLKKAKKTKGTADDKKAQEAVKKAQKAYNKTEGAKKDKRADSYLAAIGARREISYEVTKKTKDKKGKWKKTKETKTANVNLAGYINYNSATGAYQIDQKAISKIAKTNKSKAEAIAEAAEQQINDLMSKQQEAEKTALEAAEALDDFYNETYATFGAWERTITQAYILAQDLEKLSSLRNIYDATQNLEFAKLEAGFSDVGKSLPIINEALQQNRDLMLEQVQANKALVDARLAEYKAVLDNADYLEHVARYGGTETAGDLDAINTALEFLDAIGQSSNFDYAAAVQELNEPEWQEKDYDKIQQGLDKIHEKQLAYYDALTQTYESMTEVYQAIEEYQSYMADFENTLISGMEEQANKEIDKLSKLNDSLNNAAKDLIDEVKRKLDERRKQEDNAKTEQDIARKQQRLAALRADTSGGHQVEIAQLEKELAEAQQNYGRTLEDQLLDRMSAQQDEAAKQRERQINLLEAQRDLAVALGTNVDEVNQWLKNPTQNKEQIRAAWLSNQDYEDKGANDRKQLEEQFELAWTKYLAYAGDETNAGALALLKEIAAEQSLPETTETTAPSIEDIQQNVQTLVDILQKPLNVSLTHSIEELKTDSNKQQRTVKDIKRMGELQGESFSAKSFEQNGFDLKEIAENYSAQEMKAEGYKASQIKDYYTPEQLKQAYTAEDFEAEQIDYQTARQTFSLSELRKTTAYTAEVEKEARKNYKDALSALKAKGDKFTYDDVKKVHKAAANKGLTASTYMPDIVKGKGSPTWYELLKVVKGHSNKYRLARTFTDDLFKKAYDKLYGKGAYVKDRTYAKQKKIKAYQQGGLANFTGPAWLDGTPSKPELVLNARDTQNFIALKDVLAKAMNNIGNTSNTYGDVTYEINVNVDKIEKDYDVDRVIDKVKKEIIKGAGYRNVTQVRNFR